MPTKLKKPITVTITHVENAILTLMRSKSVNNSIHPNAPTLDKNMVYGEFCGALEAALVEQGIDWRTWLPEQPFKIGGHEVQFLENGGAKIGCTTLDAKEIDEFFKRRGSVTQYRFFLYRDGVYRAKNTSENGEYFSGSYWDDSAPPSIQEWLDKGIITELSREEAAVRVGLENLDK